MFYALSRLHRPQDFAAIRTKILGWLNPSKALFIFFEPGKRLFPAHLEYRQLFADEREIFENWLDEAWQFNHFGGYLKATDSTDGINSYVQFVFNEARTRARLALWIVEEDIPDPQTLDEVTADLLRENPQLREIYLPFFPETSVSRATLQALDLGPTAMPGWWRIVQEGDEPPLPPDPEDTEPAAKWLELTVVADPEAVEAISEVFARYGYNNGLVIEKKSDFGVDGSLKTDELAPVTIRTYLQEEPAAYENIEKIKEALFFLNQLRAVGELTVTERTEEEWNNTWKEFDAFHLGKHTVICPPWQGYDAKPGEIVIIIDPGMAFGTGLHPTTSLCLQLIEELYDPALYPKVLDLGTGSGILGLSAALHGASKVLGLDADTVAVRSARENVRRNRLGDKVWVMAGSITVATLDPAEGDFYAFPAESQQVPELYNQEAPFDFVLANIIARSLSVLAEPLRDAMRPGGLLISSGIFMEKAQRVIDAYAAAGLELVDTRQEGDWIAFVHRRPLI